MYCIYTRNPPFYGRHELVKCLSTRKECVRFLEEEYDTALSDTEVRHKGEVISAKRFVLAYMEELLATAV